MHTLIHKLEIILADTYALYLKTQNYHWHVKGPQFKSLHELFELQYKELANAIDEIAERIIIMGHKAPATFRELVELKTIKEGDSSLDANSMLNQLANDNATLVADLNKAMVSAQENNDEGSVNLLSTRIAAHEKAHWMLSASKEI